MHKVIIKVLNHDRSVYKEISCTADELCIEGAEWTEDDIDMAIDLLREKCPAAFALPDGTVGEYDFEIVCEDNSINN